MPGWNPLGWKPLGDGPSSLPNSLVLDTAFFQDDSAFKFLELSKKARLYGFIAWYGPIPILNVLFTKIAALRHTVWLLASY